MTGPDAPALAIEQVAIDRLRPDPANPRRIADDELDALTRSMGQWGVVQPVLARRQDSVVIAATSGLWPPGGWDSRPSRSSGSTCRSSRRAY